MTYPALYNVIESQRKIWSATFNLAAQGLNIGAAALKFSRLDNLARVFSASAEISSRVGRNNPKPEFNLPTTLIGTKTVAVTEEIVSEKAFGNLLHFKRDTKRNDPKVLLVAPMSGHYATLLRDTIETLLTHHDVYVTDWKNPRDVPMSEGEFNLESYIDYVLDFIKTIGPGVNIAGHSQSTVPVLAAVSLLSAAHSPLTPHTMTLAGGPIDTRINPTAIDKLAQKHSLQEFKDNAIGHVSREFAGHGRPVYVGALQFVAMMANAPQDQVETYHQYYLSLCNGDEATAAKIRKSCDERESFMDLHAPFMFDTIEQVFQKSLLPRLKMMHRDTLVDPTKIRHTSILTLEGGKDPICSTGQTLAAHVLCKNLGKSHHYSNIDPNAGHYELLDAARITGVIRADAKQRGLVYDPVPSNAAITIPTRLQPDQVGLYLYTLKPSANDHTSHAPKLRRA